MDNVYPLSLRRKRQSKKIRNLFDTVRLEPQQLIQPYFVYENLHEAEPLNSIAGQYRHNLESLKKTIEHGWRQDISTVLLFFIPAKKTFHYDFDAQVLQELSQTFGQDIVLATDICLCSHSLTGHCGLVDEEGRVDNNSSVQELVRRSLIHAQAGSDLLSPSDMMDSRIQAIREALDTHHFHESMIMSYSSKFSSAFYGPFREAAEPAAGFDNRKSYQIDYRNPQDAIESSLRDTREGADILMVKPGGAYLDIIYQIKHHPKLSHQLLASYQVSGEYQGLQLMAQHQMVSFKEAYLESLYALKRAGSDLIITYGANDFKKLNQEQK